MKNSVILSGLFLTILVLGGLSAYLLRERNSLSEQVVAQQTERAEGQATLVQVFSERQAAEATLEESLERQAAELSALQGEIAGLRPLATTAAALANQPTPEPASETDEIDTAPQVRIILRERESIRPVGEPIDIIASAAHPIGIAILNITVNGETLLADSPFDPRMNIVTTRWTPTEPGTYTISAVATTIRGRASTPVTIDLLVVDNSDPEAVTQSILRRIERNVEALRGLPQKDEVTINLITPGELQDAVRGDLLVDYTREDAAREVLVLSMFDFIPDDYPLYDNLIESFGQAIAGYYDPDIDTLYVVTTGTELDEQTRLTHAHEFMHALQDQYFGLALLQDDSLTKDQRLALRSLGEGEAELLEFLFQSRGYLTGEQGADSNPVFPTPEVNDIPDFLLSDFTFPYVRGFAFVNHFFETDGFTAVDTLWENIPQSSEQIIHPERYTAGDRPAIVDLPDLIPVLDGDWELLESDVFGEFYLREYLSQWLPEETVISAATGWGGDRYAVYLHPNTAAGERILVLRHIWDTAQDQTEFVTAYSEWAEARMGPASAVEQNQGRCWVTDGDNLCLFDTSAGTLILRGPDIDTLTTSAEAIFTP